MDNTLELTSYAKLNLYLKILKKRPDNYHSILTIFERISLQDKIRLKRLDKKTIGLTSKGFAVPCGKTNLIYKTAVLLQNMFKIKAGVDIEVEKNIPVSAGLGGGSSNAAAVFSGLNRLWGLNLPLKKLTELAVDIGADVPFFLRNCSFAIGSNIGDAIKPVNSKINLWHVVVVPRIKVSTPLIYRKWDSINKYTGPARLELNVRQSKAKKVLTGFTRVPLGISKKHLLNMLNIKKGAGHVRKKFSNVAGLTNPYSVIRILKQALMEENILLISKLAYNSLEDISLKIHPVIKKAKQELSKFNPKTI